MQVKNVFGLNLLVHKFAHNLNSIISWRAYILKPYSHIWKQYGLVCSPDSWFCLILEYFQKFVQVIWSFAIKQCLQVRIACSQIWSELSYSLKETFKERSGYDTIHTCTLSLLLLRNVNKHFEYRWCLPTDTFIMDVYWNTIINYNNTIKECTFTYYVIHSNL